MSAKLGHSDHSDRSGHNGRRQARYVPADDSERVIMPSAAMSGLLAWWRTTALDNTGQPYLCSHGAPAHGACEPCGRDARGRIDYDRGDRAGPSTPG